MDIKKLKEKKQSLISKMEALVNSASETLTQEQQAEFDGYKAELETVKSSIESAEALEKAKADNEVDASRPAPARKRVVKQSEVEFESPITSDSKIILPSEARKSYQLKAFKGTDGNEKAYSFGMFVRACIGDYQAMLWCADKGIVVDRFATSHNSTTDAQGGFLVPTAYGNDIQNLIYEYGIARKECNVIPLTTDTFVRPRRLTGLTAYAVGESAQGTESNKTWGNITLNVKDWMILTRMTKQLSQDALISVADDLANEIAMQFAYAEDNCLFNGDGSATYNSIEGLSNQLIDNYGESDGAGQVVGTGTLSDITLPQLRTVISKVASFARKGAKWYVNPVIFDTVFAALAEAKSGNTITNIINGVPTTFYMGYPVQFVDILPSELNDTSATEHLFYFGNLKQAVDFGDRAQLSVDFSDSAVVGGESVFERAQIAVRGYERFAMNVHSVGNDNLPTPICGFLI